MRVVFLSPGLPGPGDPAGDRIRGLTGRDDVEVTLALTETRPAGSRDVEWEGVPVVAGEDPAVAGADVAVAADWRSTTRLFSIGAARQVLLVDAFADERLDPWQAQRLPAGIVYDLPVDVLAGGQWVIDAFAERRPEVRALLARAAVDPDVFRPGPGASSPGSPLRVAVDDRWLAAGAPSDALLAVAQASAAIEAVVLPAGGPPAEHAERLRASDVLLMLDPAGGDGAAVREAMACGAVPFVLPVGGQREAVASDVSGLVVEPDDHPGIARRLDRLAAEPAELARLRAGALTAAAAWPGPDAAADELTAALDTIAAAPLPDAVAWPARLMSDAMAHAAVLANEVHALEGALRHVEQDEMYIAGVKARDTWQSARMARVRRLAAPVVRRVKPRLGPGPDPPAP